MSKKRKRCADDSKHDEVKPPPTKRMRLEKPINKMTVSELKKEIKKRDKKQKTSKIKKAELKSILFDQTRLTPSEIHALNKKQIIDQLKGHNVARGRCSWKKNDLAQYLEYIDSDPNALDNLRNSDDKEYETEITHDEWVKMPLFKLHCVYRFKTTETNRDAMYRKMQKTWQSVREWKKQKDKLLEPISNKFLKQNDDNDDDDDRVLVFHNLHSGDRMTIHQFAEKHQLFSTSVGGGEHRIIGVGRECDRSEVSNVLRREQRKIWDTLRAQQDDEWNKVIQRNTVLKETQKEDEANVYGEWRINDSDWYLYLNGSNTDNNVYGSFLIGPIEGKLVIKMNEMSCDMNRKWCFNWRGRETGENVLQIGGNKTGEIEFSESGTAVEGVLHSDYGDFTFHALKISDQVSKRASKYDFDYDEEEMYNQERVGRWH
eukprot:76455_1